MSDDYEHNITTTSAFENPRAAKRTLRREVLAHRREKYHGVANTHSARLINAHLESIISPVLEALGRPAVIASFSPVPGEASPLKFTRALAQSEHSVILPIFAGEELNWRQWDGIEQLQPSEGAKFGAEPTGKIWGTDALAHADVVLVPAVALDRSGHRLGHGKGYYDRALKYVNAGAYVVSVVHEDEVLEAGTIGTETHDVLIPRAMTEGGLVEFTMVK